MILSPSLLSADFSRLQEELNRLGAAGVSWLHLDVMDGSFVPNITFGPPVIKSLRAHSNLFFDVHLMINEPSRYIYDFADAGADLIVIHAEAERHLERTLSQIKNLGLKAGIALNPATDLSVLNWIYHTLDLVLLMSVNPGFSGQKFIEQTYNKLRTCRKLLNSFDNEIIIEVDGGVSPANAGQLVQAGADVLVSGSAFFSHSDYVKRKLEFDVVCQSDSSRMAYIQEHFTKKKSASPQC